ncbi:MAG TPA: hypothetical protein VIL36_14985 [Acidimicrobiales bacterium]
MHPIEWLRAVARSGDVPQTRLAVEAAGALAAIADEPHGLLPACRRLIDRNPAAGSLWWTCARLLSAGDPVAEADNVQRDLESDQVGLSLALDLPDEAAVVVLGWSDIAGEMAARRGDVRLMVVAEETPPRARGRGGGWGPEEDDEAEETVVIVPPLGLGAAVTSADLLLVDAWAMGDNEVIAAPGTLAAVAVAARMHTPVWCTVSVGRRLPEALFKALTDRVYRPGVEPWDAPVDLLDLKGTALTVVEPLAIPCPVPPELLRRTS